MGAVDGRAGMVMAAVMLAMVAGCSSRLAERSSSIIEVAPTNGTVARMVVTDALEQVPFGTLPDSVVAVRCIGDSTVTAMVSETAETSLTLAGFEVSGDENGRALVTITVDSLVVAVRTHYTVFGRRTADRRATAALTVEVTPRPGRSRTYRVRGSRRDRLDPSMVDRMTTDGASYVTVIDRGNPVLMYGKPLGLAVFLTALVWTLYSYRG